MLPADAMSRCLMLEYGETQRQVACHCKGLSVRRCLLSPVTAGGQHCCCRSSHRAVDGDEAYFHIANIMIPVAEDVAFVIWANRQLGWMW